jgi:hypothetical protein
MSSVCTLSLDKLALWRASVLQTVGGTGRINFDLGKGQSGT